MTGQLPDYLRYQGESFALLSNPLESYIENHSPAPAFAATSTANWRGYVATWEIADERLYLVGLTGRICTRTPEPGCRPSAWCPVEHEGSCDLTRIGLGDLFDAPDGKVLAAWYSGELRIPQGERVSYVHLDYCSRYERHLLFGVENGRVVETSILGDEDYERVQAAAWARKRRAERPWWALRR